MSSADDSLIEVAKELRKGASSAITAKVLDSFVEDYSRLKITQSITVCLACFSTAKDDPKQWKRYGDHGLGICLGVRMLGESAPIGLSTGLFKVDYDESSWRSGLRDGFGKICEVLARTDDLPRNVELGIAALNRIAAVHAMTVKRPEWAVEQEFRRITLVPRRAHVQLLRHDSNNGVKQYLPVAVRDSRRRIAFGEIWIGPNRNAESARDELKSLLARNGYVAGSAEYPVILASATPPLC